MVANDEPIETKPLNNKIIQKKKMGRKKKEEVVYSRQEKEKAFLSYLNWCLKKIGQEEIVNITDFKNTEKNKLDAIDFNTDSSWELMLFPVFSRISLRYSGRNKENKTYIVTVIRRVCKELGYTLKNYSCKKIDGQSIVYYTKYSILS